MAPRPIYRNPFRFPVGAARIDAGVDYCGNGPVHAIGPGRILQRGVPSHTTSFGNSLSSYVITEGPLRGIAIFFAEHYNLAPHIFPGNPVDASTLLYEMNGCIEIGVATEDGRYSKAWHEMDYHEGQLSVLGEWMSDLLKLLGAPAGLKTGRQPVGKLPPDIPTNLRKTLDGWIKG